MRCQEPVPDGRSSGPSPAAQLITDSAITAAGNTACTMKTKCCILVASTSYKSVQGVAPTRLVFLLSIKKFTNTTRNFKMNML